MLLCNCIQFTFKTSGCTMPLKSVSYLFQLSYLTLLTNRLLAINFEDVKIASLSMIMKDISYTIVNQIEIGSTAQ